MCISADAMSNIVTMNSALYHLLSASSLKDINLRVMQFSSSKAAIIRRVLTGCEEPTWLSIGLGFLERNDLKVLVRDLAKTGRLPKLNVRYYEVEGLPFTSAEIKFFEQPQVLGINRLVLAKIGLGI